MKTLTVDTNAVLRYLTNDIPLQANKVKTYLIKAQKGQISLELTLIVIVEIMFQLQHWYEVSKEKAANSLITFISPDWIKVKNKSAVLEAIKLYKSKNIDLVDLLLWSTATAEEQQILSFDKDFDKLEPSIRLKP